MYKRRLLALMTACVIAAGTLAPSYSASATPSDVRATVESADDTVATEDEYDEDELLESIENEIREETAFASKKKALADEILTTFQTDTSRMSVVSLEEYISSLLNLVDPASVDDFIIGYYTETESEPEAGNIIIKPDGSVYFYMDDTVGLTYNYPEKGSRVKLSVESADMVLQFNEEVAENTFSLMAVMTAQDMVEEAAADTPFSSTKGIESAGYKPVTIKSAADVEIGDAQAEDGHFVFYIGSGQAVYKNSETTFNKCSWTYDSSAEHYRYDKKVPTYTVPTVDATFGDHLEDIPLPPNFKWNNPDTRVLTVGTVTHPVTYTPDNTVKYKSVDTIQAKINVAKKIVSSLTAPEVNGTYQYSSKRKLSSIPLPDDWEWVDGDIIPTPDVKTYRARFAPQNLEGYEITASTTEFDVKINVIRSSLKVPENFSFQVPVGTKLSEIPLATRPDGKYKWEENEITFRTAGKYTYHITFIPNDSNYSTVNNIPAIITVTNGGSITSGDQNSETPTGVTAYFGQRLADVSLPSGWTWVSSQESVGAVGEKLFPATYNGKTYSVQITVLKAKAATVIKPTPQKLTYSKGVTTGSIILPSHWSFKENKELAIGEHEYAIIYTPTDSASYDYSDQTLDTTMTITVSKAIPEYVYPNTVNIKSGKTLADNLLPKSDSGTYSWTSDTSEAITKSGTYYCKYTPTDSEHYYVVKDIPVSVVVSSSSTESSSSGNKDTSSNTTKNDSSNENKNNSSSSGSGAETAKASTTTQAATTDTAKKVDSTTQATTSGAENKTQNDIQVEQTATTEERELKIRPVTVNSTTETTEEATTELIKEGNEDTPDETTEEEEQITEEKQQSPTAAILIVIVIGGLCVGGYFFYKKMTAEQTEDTL